MPLLDEREFQLEMLKLQIRHQHDASFCTAAMAVIISVGASVTLSYMSFGLVTKDFTWVLEGIAFLAFMLVPFFYILIKYRGIQKNLDTEIQNLKRKYAAY